MLCYIAPTWHGCYELVPNPACCLLHAPYPSTQTQNPDN